MRRVTIPQNVVDWARTAAVPTGRPGLVDRACYGLAIAPESAVRGVRLRFRDGELVPLIEGSPVTVPGLRKTNRIEVHPLDYQTGDLVLAIAETLEELPHLPVTMVENVAVTVRIAGGSGEQKIRLASPRKAQSMPYRLNYAFEVSGQDALETDPSVDVERFYLDHLGRMDESGARDHVEYQVAGIAVEGDGEIAPASAVVPYADVIQLRIADFDASQDCIVFARYGAY